MYDKKDIANIVDAYFRCLSSMDSSERYDVAFARFVLECNKLNIDIRKCLRILSYFIQHEAVLHHLTHNLCRVLNNE